MQNPVRLTSLSIPTVDTYRSAAFQANGATLLGIVVRANQALTVSLAYGSAADTAAAEGTSSSASLPGLVAGQACASSDAAEGGTYLEFTVPPGAQKLQWAFYNATGSTATISQADYAFAEEDERRA